MKQITEAWVKINNVHKNSAEKVRKAHTDPHRKITVEKIKHSTEQNLNNANIIRSKSQGKLCQKQIKQELKEKRGKSSEKFKEPALDQRGGSKQNDVLVISRKSKIKESANQSNKPIRQSFILNNDILSKVQALCSKKKNEIGGLAPGLEKFTKKTKPLAIDIVTPRKGRIVSGINTFARNTIKSKDSKTGYHHTPDPSHKKTIDRKNNFVEKKEIRTDGFCLNRVNPASKSVERLKQKKNK